MKHYFNMIQYEKEKDTNVVVFKREKTPMQDTMEHPPQAITMYNINHKIKKKAQDCHWCNQRLCNKKKCRPRRKGMIFNTCCLGAIVVTTTSKDNKT